MPPGLDESIDNLLLRAGVRREHIALARARSCEDGELAKHLEQIAGLSENRYAAMIAERLGLQFSPDVADDEIDPSRSSPAYRRRFAGPITYCPSRSSTAA